jgi:GT2 family glycosyltransferase
MSSPVGAAEARPAVTAVLVAANGERWLPALLGGLAAQTRPPDRVVAVVTAGEDRSLDLLRDALGPQAVVEAPRAAGFGAAIDVGVDAADRARSSVPGGGDAWLWLLHDDCAPDPRALSALLDAAAGDPRAAVLGPKVRAWPAERRLCSAGLSITGTGRREAGVEPGELDQGQHDSVRPVLAVDSAGMLVRRPVWEALHGFDPHLPMFRDDVDFGWRANRAGHRVLVCPQAVVYHAEAGRTGQRRLHAVRGSADRADRRSALYALLANVSAVALPFVALRLVAGSLLRAAGFVLGKAPALARDELLALAGVVAHPSAVLAGRRERKRSATTPASSVRTLLPPWQSPYRRGLDVVLGRLTLLRGTDTGAEHSRHSRDPVSPAAGQPAAMRRWLSALAAHAGLVAVGVATLVALLAGRGLLGPDALQGGALLPPPAGAADWWHSYLASWHPVGLGSAAEAPTYVGVLALLSTALLGKAWLALDVLVLFAVPLATATAYLALLRWVRSPAVRVVAALTYGLLPAMTGAVAQGRLGTLVATIALPMLARSATALLSSPGSQQQSGSRWGAVFSTGLWLAVVAAFAMVALPLAAVLAVFAALLLVRSVRGVVQLGAVFVVALAALLPELPALLFAPVRWLGEAGFAGALVVEPGFGAALGLGRPGGPGMAPAWISLGVVVAAAAALLRRDRRAGVLAAWLVAQVAFAAALVESRIVTPTTPGYAEVLVWPGFATTLAQAGLLAAAALAADGVASRLAGRRFSWRQPTAVLVAVLAAATPVLGLVWLAASGVAGPLHRAAAVPLPSYLLAQQQSDARTRTLLLHGDTTRLRYSLVRDDGLRTGEDALAPAARSTAGLDTVVARLVSSPTAAEVSRLAGYGVAQLVAAAPADAELTAALDEAPGLRRTSAGTLGAAAWQLTAPTGRARLVTAGSPDVVLPSGASTVAVDVPSSAASRSVVLAETFDSDWRAELDGSTLPAHRYAGWAQAFRVAPDSGGELRVVRGGDTRRWWLLAQAGVVLAALVVAGPGIRRERGAHR